MSPVISGSVGFFFFPEKQKVEQGDYYIIRIFLLIKRTVV